MHPDRRSFLGSVLSLVAWPLAGLLPRQRPRYTQLPVRPLVDMPMTIKTIQWTSQGGMELNFKVMAIQLPSLRDRLRERSLLQEINVPADDKSA